jgi:hypothetical protein
MYRERLAAIEAEIADAEAGGDRGAVERLVHERELLGVELARGVELAGTERYIVRQLKEVFGRITEHDRTTADYLRGAIRIGTYFSFRP